MSFSLFSSNNEWAKFRLKNSNFEQLCQTCGSLFQTENELKNHVLSGHRVILEGCENESSIQTNCHELVEKVINPEISDERIKIDDEQEEPETVNETTIEVEDSSELTTGKETRSQKEHENTEKENTKSPKEKIIVDGSSVAVLEKTPNQEEEPERDYGDTEKDKDKSSTKTDKNINKTKGPSENEDHTAKQNGKEITKEDRVKHVQEKWAKV